MSRHVRWYRRLVRCYPHGFRDRFEAEMVMLFADQLRDAQATGRRSAIVELWVRSIADLVVTAPSEHLAQGREAVPQPADAGVLAAAPPGSGAHRRVVTLLAASPLLLWIALQVVAPGFTDPVYANPPGLLGLPAGLLVIGVALVLAMLGVLLVRRTRSAIAALAVLASITLPAWALIILTPPLVLIVTGLGA